MFSRIYKIVVDHPGEMKGLSATWASVSHEEKGQLKKLAEEVNAKPFLQPEEMTPQEKRLAVNYLKWEIKLILV